jgi:hypothetical protein
MPRPSSPNPKYPNQTAIRLTPEERSRVEAVSAELTRRAAGVALGIPTAVRAAFERGLPLLEKELGLGPDDPPKSKSAGRTKRPK